MDWKRLGAGALCVLALTSGAAGCGGDDGPSEDELRAAREEGEKEGRDRERLRDLERQLREREKEDGGADEGRGSDPDTPNKSQPAPTTRRTACGGGLEAGPNTTCAFARNVRDEYNSSGGSGSMSLVVYSPATEQNYPMSCTGGSPHVCTGGNNASVYFP